MAEAEREMIQLEKIGIIPKGFTRYRSLILFKKRKHQNMFRVCRFFRLLNDRWFSISKVLQTS